MATEEMKAELTELEQAIETQEQRTKSLVENWTSAISHLEADKASAIEEIRGASEKAVDLIKKQEKELIDQVGEITDREIKELESDIEQGNIQIQNCKQLRDNLKQAVSPDSEAEVREMLEQWKSGQLDTSQDGDKGIVGGHISGLQFCKEKQNITEVHLGEIVTFEPVCDPKTSPVQSDTFMMRQENDTQVPYILDIVILDVGGVETTIVTDWKNQCLKSFYTKNYRRCHKRLVLENPPWGITQLGDNKLMVPLPRRKEVVTVAVAPDQNLEQVSSIKVQQSYYNLAVISTSSFGAAGAGCVDILNMQGEVLQTYRDVKRFSFPRYLCLGNNGDLLVSDFDRKMITSIAANGEITCLHSGDEEQFESSRGITTTRSGNILVVVLERDLKVVQLSKSGEYVRGGLIDTHKQSPGGICVDKHGSLLVCAGTSVLKFQFIKK